MTTISTKNMDGKRKVLKGNFITHFFVTAVHTGVDSFQDSPEIWKNKSSRCWGYTDTFEKAEEAVLANYTDIHECTDQWVIIEEHIMDVLALGTGLFQWYHWNNDTDAYERCEQPEWAKNIVHWGIG